MNLTELIDASAKRFPDKPAVIDAEAVISYADLAAWSSELAGQLRVHGVRAGQRIGISFPNSIAYIVATLAVWRVEAAAVPVPIESSTDERSHIIHSLGLHAVIGHHSGPNTIPLARIGFLE